MEKVKSFSVYLKGVNKRPEINSGRSMYIQSQDICKLASDLIDFMGDEFGIKFEKDVFPTIEFTRAKQKSLPIFKQTGNYTPLINHITIYVDGRSIKDCMRSLAHELIHVDQKINKGMDIEKASEGIYKKSKNAERIESDAYERGNLVFRKWEESLKGKSSDPIKT